MALLATSPVAAQKPKAAKGPRAVALVEIGPKGKASLIPVAILVDGKFYDASVYKATPVPMALESGTVYEAFRTGVSKGFFTVTGALQTKDTWLGAGTWQPAGSTPPGKKTAAPARPASDDADGPPVLRKPGSQPAKPATPPPTAPAPDATAKPSTPPPTPPPDDAGRPVLRRGAPSDEEMKKREAAESLENLKKADAADTARIEKETQLIPAISDAGGPDAQPYSYEMKPDEEQVFRKKMLAIAAEEVKARARLLSQETAPPKGKVPSKGPEPTFDDVQLRVFDLSNSNEPVAVLTATAKLPANGDLGYYVTLVAREDIYGDFHKALSNITDTRHMDALARMELIDAVDADGNGRGELLFRRVSDAGKAFSIYRVIGNQLFPLFEGTPE